MAPFEDVIVIVIVIVVVKRDQAGWADEGETEELEDPQIRRPPSVTV